MHWKASADMDWNKFLHGAIAEEDIDLVRQALLEGADPKNLCKNLGYVCIFRRAQRIALTSSQASLLLVVCS